MANVKSVTNESPIMLVLIFSPSSDLHFSMKFPVRKVDRKSEPSLSAVRVDSGYMSQDTIRMLMAPAPPSHTQPLHDLQAHRSHGHLLLEAPRGSTPAVSEIGVSIVPLSPALLPPQ